MSKNEIEKAKLLLEFIKSHGFDPDNYDRTLELFAGANDSMSQHLTDYDQYLLSRRVDSDDLDIFGINGGYGYIDEDGEILLPKCFKNDDRFLYAPVRRPYTPFMYESPSIEDFRVIIGNHNPMIDENEELRQLMSSLNCNYSLDQFYSILLDEDSRVFSKELTALYCRLVRTINEKNGSPLYTFEQDTIDNGKIKLCLIKGSK